MFDSNLCAELLASIHVTVLFTVVPNEDMPPSLFLRLLASSSDLFIYRAFVGLSSVLNESENVVMENRLDYLLLSMFLLHLKLDVYFLLSVPLSHACNKGL